MLTNVFSLFFLREDKLEKEIQGSWKIWRLTYTEKLIWIKVEYEFKCKFSWLTPDEIATSVSFHCTLKSSSIPYWAVTYISCSVPLDSSPQDLLVKEQNCGGGYPEQRVTLTFSSSSTVFIVHSWTLHAWVNAIPRRYSSKRSNHFLTCQQDAINTSVREIV